MPKRSIYLTPSDHLYRRTRRDLEFLCNYWDRLLTANQSYDVRLPELLRANHLMRHLSSLSLPLNQGLQVNVSFTIVDDGNPLKPKETYQLNNAMSNYIESRNGFHRSNNAARYNDSLRSYIRQINKNYAAIERELMRARLLAPLEHELFTGCQNTFYNKRTATCNWNKFPAGNRTCFARISPRSHDRHVNPRGRNNQTSSLFSHACCNVNRKHDCSINQQSARQKENSFEFEDSSRIKQCSLERFRSPIVLKSDNNCTGTAAFQNDNEMIKQQSSKETMEACQDVSKIISDAVISHPAESRPVKSNDIAINNSDKQSIDPVDCQRNILVQTAETSVMNDQNAAVQNIKCKLDDFEDRTAANEFDIEVDRQQDCIRMTEKARIDDTPTTSIPDEKRSKIRNDRTSMGEKSFWKKRVSPSKYASFLRVFRKEEAEDDRLRNNYLSRRGNEEEKSQGRKKTFEESSVHDNQVNSQTEKRKPTPRSTVHTTYNPIMHSSATDPILDSNSLTIQLLRLAVLLYAPTLMPALNSLIAQQNQQTPMSTSAFESSNDLLTQIFRMLNEQQSISNLPFVSIESEKVPSALCIETNGESSRSLSEEKEEDTSTVLEKSEQIPEQGSISGGRSSWKSNNHEQQQNEKNKNWRLTSLLADPDVRLDGQIFTAEDFRKFEEFLKAKKKRPEDDRSLSKSKNEVAMKEYFRNWLHRLVKQLNSTSNNLPVKIKERECPKGSPSTTGESSLEDVEQRNKNHLVSDESPDFSRDDGNFPEREEEEDSEAQKSFTSATSTNSSMSQSKQDNAIAKNKE